MSTLKMNAAGYRLVWSLAVICFAALFVWFGADLNTAKAQVKVKDRGTVASNLGGTTFPGTGTGAIPDRGSPGCGPPAGPNLDISFNVTGLPAEAPGSVDLDITLGHTWVGDLNVSLIAPDATEHVVFASTGSTTATGCGDSSDLGATYLFGDSETGDWWAEAGAQTGGGVLTAGGYRTTVSGDQPSPPGGDPSDMNAAFAGIPDQNGTWILRLNDSGGGDTGSVSAANLTLGGGTPPPPPDIDFDGDGTSDYSVVRDITPPPAGPIGIVGTRTGPIPDRVKSSRRSINELQKDPGFKPLDPAGSSVGPPNPGTDLGWYIAVNNGNDPARVQGFGQPATDFWVPQDYDGDGQDDIAVWRGVAPAGPSGGFLFVFQSSTSTVTTTDFGQQGDNPTVIGDYDGDGTADPAVYRCPSGGGQCTFFYKGSAGGGEITFFDWGNNSSAFLRAYPGDFDGDGRNDFCVAQNGQYILARSSDNGVEWINWGLPSDAVIAPGDYDGDGRTDFMNIRVNGTDVEWWLLDRNGGQSTTTWGALVPGFAEFATQGDFDGDGATDIGIWRRDNASNDNSFFYTLRSSDGMLQTFEWGSQGDAPVPGWNSN